MNSGDDNFEDDSLGDRQSLAALSAGNGSPELLTHPALLNTGLQVISNTPTANPLVNKLSSVIDLSDDDVQALHELCDTPRSVRAHQDLIADGDRPDYVILILGGWACRYKILRNGMRQITAFMLPGDLCDMNVTILSQMDHGISALTTVRMAFISRDQFDALTNGRPHLLHALWWMTLVDEGVLRAWIVNNGRRSARERIAHLLCELRLRAAQAMPVQTDDFHLPLTQIEIADAVGMTPVHVNRIIGQLAAEGLVTLDRGKSIINDVAALERIADFDPSYLHAQHLRWPGERKSCS